MEIMTREELVNLIINELNQQLIQGEIKENRLIAQIQKESQQYYLTMVQKQNDLNNRFNEVQEMLKQSQVRLNQAFQRNMQAKVMEKRYTCQAQEEKETRNSIGANLKQEKINNMVCNDIKNKINEEIEGDALEVKQSRKKVKFLEHKLRNLEIMLGKQIQHIKGLRLMQVEEQNNFRNPARVKKSCKFSIGEVTTCSDTKRSNRLRDQNSLIKCSRMKEKDVEVNENDQINEFLISE